MGRSVEVILLDGTIITGKLINASEDEFTIGEVIGKGKSKIVKENSILFNQIKHTKVLVTF